MATAERKLKLAERIQKDGQPHKFKRWVYLYHRYKSRIIAVLLIVITVLLAGLIYVGWKLYEKEPGIVMRADQFTVFQSVEDKQHEIQGYEITIDEDGEADLSPLYNLKP